MDKNHINMSSSRKVEFLQNNLERENKMSLKILLNQANLNTMKNVIIYVRYTEFVCLRNMQHLEAGYGNKI